MEILQLTIKDWEKKNKGTERGLCAYFYDKNYKELSGEEKDYLVFILSTLWTKYAEFTNGIYLWSLVTKRREKRIEVLERVLKDVMEAKVHYVLIEYIVWEINGFLVFLKND